jgi:predicted glutamine amidotransferase
MCRWLAYSGDPVFLDEVLFKTEHSLIDQSLRSKDALNTTNGDGYGVGWYAQHEEPGVYKDIRPAWNDANLQALAAQIQSPMFLAHVRATTGTAIQRSNCHPFTHRQWLFVHNGLVNNYDRLRRDLTIAIDPGYFPLIHGSTDSEIMFLLALTFGMEGDVKTGLERMAGLVEHVARSHDVNNALQMTLGISDGESLYAVRYSTEGNSRTLFHSSSRDATMDIAPDADRFSRHARAIVSEPLSNLEAEWTLVPESTFLKITKGDVTCERFSPIEP